MELNTGLETGMVSTGLVVMLGMAVWLFFRGDSNGEQSLFLKMMAPNDDELEKGLSVPPFLPSFNGGASNAFVHTHGHGFDVLNQTMRVIPFVHQKEASMESQGATTIDLQDRTHTVQIEPVRQSSGGHWQKSAGMFLGQRSLGGILVVDDDPDNRKLIRILLENFGYDVLEAEDGAQAINAVTSGENPMVVDTIITDLSMPKIDGFESHRLFPKRISLAFH